MTLLSLVCQKFNSLVYKIGCYLFNFNFNSIISEYFNVIYYTQYTFCVSLDDRGKDGAQANLDDEVQGFRFTKLRYIL